VENTSHLPIHLLEAQLRRLRLDMVSRKMNPAYTWIPRSAFATLEFDLQGGQKLHSAVLIPPGGSHECFFYVYQKKDPVQWLRDIDVRYSWISGTAAKADYLRVRLRRIVPENWRSHIPSRLYERDITPLDSQSCPPPVTPSLVMASPVTPFSRKTERRRFFLPPRVPIDSP
ncbi:MAG: hypothetical protein ACAH88_20250, partial [Roseimicrobium sp.]